MIDAFAAVLCLLQQLTTAVLQCVDTATNFHVSRGTTVQHVDRSLAVRDQVRFHSPAALSVRRLLVAATARF